VHIGERSKKTVADPAARTVEEAATDVIALGNALGRAEPWQSVTSLTGSSPCNGGGRTEYPLVSSRRRTAVFPAPGAPVRMYDSMAIPFVQTGGGN
jgi:hypothetical protein